MIDLRRDGFVLLVLGMSVVLLAAALSGAYHAFGYGLVAFLGLLAGLGFVRAGRVVTWMPPVVVTLVLLVAIRGMFLNETTPVTTAGDTVMGFQAGTAYLVYGVWIPAFFTMGLGFSLVFNHLGDDRR
jgi:uncharacterized membrane protein YagU involved in acid resistance